MAIVNNDNTIMFDETEFKKAWDNAPKLANKDEEEYRLCYICKFHLKRDEFIEIKNDPSFWCIDFIDTKHFSLEPENIVAVHSGCVEIRQKPDARKLLKKIKSVEWKFDEDFYKIEE